MLVLPVKPEPEKSGVYIFRCAGPKHNNVDIYQRKEADPVHAWEKLSAAGLSKGSSLKKVAREFLAKCDPDAGAKTGKAQFRYYISRAPSNIIITSEELEPPQDAEGHINKYRKWREQFSGTVEQFADWVKSLGNRAAL